MSTKNLTIKPDYKFQHTCHFCKQRVAEEGKEELTKCYYFEKAFHMNGVYHNYKYHVAKVYIPCCKQCSDKDFKISLIIFCILLIIFCILVYVLSGEFAKSDHLYQRSWSNILIACGPVTVISPIIFVILRYGYILLCLLFSKDDGLLPYLCIDYRPIKRLSRDGWKPRSSGPGKEPNIKGCGPLDINKFKSTISKILTEDNCRIVE